jgi:hypothetical protein
MNSVFLGMAALACPLSMGLMMWFMAKGMGRGKEKESGAAQVSNVEALREEHRRLGERIEQIDHERPGVGSRG